MNILDKIKDGDIVYGVHEKYVYIRELHKNSKVWAVTEETVTKHYQHKYKEIFTSDGSTPRYYRQKDFGKVVFLNLEDAENLAKERALKDGIAYMSIAEKKNDDGQER